MRLPAKDTSDCYQTPEARKRQRRILLYRFQREHGPADILILNFWLPDVTTDFYHFKAPSPWCFVTAALENWCILLVGALPSLPYDRPQNPPALPSLLLEDLELRQVLLVSPFYWRETVSQGKQLAQSHKIKVKINIQSHTQLQSCALGQSLLKSSARPL